MKAILISVKPQFVADILNGRKTLEIRKTMPQCALPMDVYIYCTQTEGLARIQDGSRNGSFVVEKNITEQNFKYMESGYDGKGKVVAKFTLNDVRQIYIANYNTYYEYKPVDMTSAHLVEKSCLSQKELDKYLHKKKGYAWCIENLTIFEKPIELYEFRVAKPFEYTNGKKGIMYYPLTHAPQSWCYCLESEYE